MIQTQTLKNLRPETVIELHEVNFASRVLALPDVMDVAYSIDDFEVFGDDETSISVYEEMSQRPDCEEIMVLMSRHIVVGGLIYDHDTESPLENDDDSGEIIQRRLEENRFLLALGLDENGGRDLDHEAVTEELITQVMQWLRQDLLVVNMLSQQLARQATVSDPENVFKIMAFEIRHSGWTNALERIAHTFLEQPAWSDVSDDWKDNLTPLSELLTENAAEEAWDRAFEAGKIASPMIVPLDRHVHMSVSFEIPSSFDPFSVDALWIPCSCAEDNIQDCVTRELGFKASDLWGAGWSWHEAINRRLAASGRPTQDPPVNRMLHDRARCYAKGIIESYNQWTDGNVFGLVVNVFDRITRGRIEQHDDECWGFFGREYAKEELEQNILYKVSSLAKCQ